MIRLLYIYAEQVYLIIKKKIENVIQIMENKCYYLNIKNGNFFFLIWVITLQLDLHNFV